MADKKITQLNTATALQGDENIVVVQSSETKKATLHQIKNYIVAEHLTAEANEDYNLDVSVHDNTRMFKFSWEGGSGTADYTLPSAVSHPNRIIRFVSDSSFATNTHLDLYPKSSETLDGSTNAYRINKAFEGLAIWSDGAEWFIIQKKA